MFAPLETIERMERNIARWLPSSAPTETASPVEPPRDDNNQTSAAELVVREERPRLWTVLMIVRRGLGGLTEIVVRERDFLASFSRCSSLNWPKHDSLFACIDGG